MTRLAMNGFCLIPRGGGTYEIEVKDVIVGKLVIEPDDEGGDEDEEAYTVTDYKDIEEDGTYGGLVVFSADEAWSLIRRMWVR